MVLPAIQSTAIEGVEGERVASSEPPAERLEPEENAPLDGYRFSTGHRVIFIRSGKGEEVQVRSAEGSVQVRIVLTAAGPVLKLVQADLEIEALDTVRTVCRRFEVAAQEQVQVTAGESVSLQAEGHLRLSSSQELVAKAALIRLN